MGWQIVRRVHQTRLPKEMRRRPEAKLVLTVLAHFADATGCNAWPSVNTIATASEIGSRTCDKVLVSCNGRD